MPQTCLPLLLLYRILNHGNRREEYEKEIVIAYFNYVDKNWGIDNIISEKVLKDIIQAIEID